MHVHRTVDTLLIDSRAIARTKKNVNSHTFYYTFANSNGLLILLQFIYAFTHASAHKYVLLGLV